MAEFEAIDTQETHEAFAKKINGEIWALLEKPDRTPDEDERMVIAAHASYYHWLHAGTHVHEQRGERMLAHVYTVLGRDEPALHHARRCIHLTERYTHEIKDFDRGYAHEALARARALTGQVEEARRERQKAGELGAQIQDPEDRQIFLGDLQGGPWYALEGTSTT